MQETGVQSLGWEGPLEKEMAIHSSSLSLENSKDRGSSPWGCKELDMTEQLSPHTLPSKMLTVKPGFLSMFRVTYKKKNVN